MRLHIVSVSQKMPQWITEGFHEYQKRLPKEYALTLTEIPLSKRSKSDSKERIIQQVSEEGARIQRSLPKASKTVALEIKGKLWSSEQLADNLSNWQQECNTVNFLIGGPDGLSEECLERADQLWSLSHLTLPHSLVRIILAEQLYRAVCILQRHPYHRA